LRLLETANTVYSVREKERISKANFTTAILRN
jgi:hypothetical protein